ncbi:hypothetical protein [Serratia liquefaciens]|uniref:type II toxin-antitoxin system RelB family antitoxin n=1 Tax=Serratia liquefaciens TaxID=614 RepID=UPI001D9430E5|nr:hypothetical protein [Serratia liquefaciens]NLU17426.1 hypothetical protein [Serratia liquefaciens]
MAIKPPLSTLPVLGSAEQTESYDRWYRAKVESAINSEQPRISHEQVMTELQARLAAKKKLRKMG